MFVVVGYSLVGTILTEKVGRRVFTAKQVQLKKEATFRYSLTWVGNNSESIAFYQGEEQELKSVNQRFVDVISNYHLNSRLAAQCQLPGHRVLKLYFARTVHRYRAAIFRIAGGFRYTCQC